MRLSELMPHTANWTGIPETQVKTVARVLQPAGLISSAGKNPRGVEMTTDDKINLFLGVCGVEVANRAAEHVRVWRGLVKSAPESNHPFAFLQATTVKDFLVDLITKDLNGGELSKWLKEADDAYDRDLQSRGARSGLPVRDHSITLDFYVDEFSLTLIVTRYSPLSGTSANRRQSTADIVKVSFIQHAPGGEREYIAPHSSKVRSHLIRRLTEESLIGWGTCLND